jgi:hypothetical protein
MPWQLTFIYLITLYNFLKTVMYFKDATVSATWLRLHPVSETSVSLNYLVRLSVRENFKEYYRRESFKNLYLIASMCGSSVCQFHPLLHIHSR